MPPVFPDIWRLGIAVAADRVPLFEEVFERVAEAVTTFMDDRSGRSDGEGEWQIEGYSRQAPDRAAIVAALAVVAAAHGVAAPELTVEKLPNQDWVAQNLRDFPPIDAGRFFVRGSHWSGKVPAGRLEILMDAGTAFGSGEHATTRGCLLALDGLGKRRRAGRALDLGCGSGILAIAMAKMWACPVLATDIDPSAVRVAAGNAAANGVGARVSAVVSDGWRNPEMKRREPFDVVTANILARPLCRFAPRLAAALAPGGAAVLSGLLEWQERMVMAVHERQGLRLKSRRVVDGWATLVVGR
ncbi:MAG: 50S ribosomal protein L11 methyltransferase [Magnetospirillum sp.]|nr:50S ribosomal protein L11 methyltransferase [Magnetospirillum sp.]